MALECKEIISKSTSQIHDICYINLLPARRIHRTIHPKGRFDKRWWPRQRSDKKAGNNHNPME